MEANYPNQATVSPLPALPVQNPIVVQTPNLAPLEQGNVTPLEIPVNRATPQPSFNNQSPVVVDVSNDTKAFFSNQNTQSSVTQANTATSHNCRSTGI